MADDNDAQIGVHYQEIKSLLWAITRNEATAEELAQETYIVALKRGMFVNVQGEGVRLWLRETARRLALNELRRKRPKSLDPEVLGGIASALHATDANAGAEMGAATFDDELMALRECMTDLSETDRQLLAARYEHGTPIAEIAVQLKLSPDYIKLKLFRLRKVLGERIKRKVSGHA